MWARANFCKNRKAAHCYKRDYYKLLTSPINIKDDEEHATGEKEGFYFAGGGSEKSRFSQMGQHFALLLQCIKKISRKMSKAASAKTMQSCKMRK